MRPVDPSSSFPANASLRARAAGILIFAAIALVVPSPVSADGRWYNGDPTIQTSHADWMKWINGNVKLSELSIPGTHNSLFKEGNDFNQYQGLDLNAQLNAGIRVLHLPMDYKATDTFVAHKRTDPNPSFDQVLTTVGSFLAAHPDETVLIAFQAYLYSDLDALYSTTEEVIAAYSARFDRYRVEHPYGARIWQPSTCNGPIPTLDQVRGKIVMLEQSRMDCDGIPFPTSTLKTSALDPNVVLDNTDQCTFLSGSPLPPCTLQNYDNVNSVWGIDDKWALVKKHLERADQSNGTALYINFLNAEDGGIWLTELCAGTGAAEAVAVTAAVEAGLASSPPGWVLLGIAAAGCTFSASTHAFPYAVAGGSVLDNVYFFDGINDLVLGHLVAGKVANRTGILMMDFPGAAIIDAIIAKNFRFTRDVNGNGLIDELAGAYSNMVNNVAYNGTEIGGNRQALDRTTLLGTFTRNVLPYERGYFDGVRRIDTAHFEFSFIDDPCTVFDWIAGLFVTDPTCVPTEVGYSVTHAGLFRESDWIDTDNIFETRAYKSVGFNQINGWKVLNQTILDALPAFVSGQCPSFAATNAGALGLRQALEQQFPNVYWNVVIKDGEGGFDNWSVPGVSGQGYDTGGNGHRCVVWGGPITTAAPIPGNQQPVFTSPTVLVDEVNFLGIHIWLVIAQDPDPLDTPVVTPLDLPDWIWVQPCGTGCLQLNAQEDDPVTPAQFGNAHIKLRVSDGKSDPVVGDFVVKLNLPPAFLDADGTPIPDVTTVDYANPIQFPDTTPGLQRWWVRAIDPNEDQLAIIYRPSVCGAQKPAWLNGPTPTLRDGTAELWATNPPPGQYEFCLSAYDGQVYEDQAFRLIVDVNDSPTVAATSAPIGAPSIVAPLVARADGSFNWDVSASDLEGDTLSIEAVEIPDWLTLQDHGDGTATLSAVAPAYGSHAIVLRVGDGVSSPTDRFFDLKVQVTNPVDGQAGSVRDVLAQIAPGQEVSLHPVLGGQTIALTQGPLSIAKDVVIDGSFAPNGVTLSGSDATPVLQVDSGRVSVRDLTLAHGRSYAGGSGGCVVNNGELTLEGVTVTDCHADVAGGGIWNVLGTLTLVNSTVVGNSTVFIGGGISNNNHVTVRHSTIFGNQVNNGGGRGGGLDAASGAVYVVENSIVAQNVAPSGADISKGTGSIQVTGSNLIGDNQTVNLELPEGPLVGTRTNPKSPGLLPLGHYGGPTRTMHPLPGSPVIDAALATVDSPGRDQRGSVRLVDGDGDTLAENDLGAVEVPEPGLGMSLASGLAVLLVIWRSRGPGFGAGRGRALSP